jgi:hypothetical protein
MVRLTRWFAIALLLVGFSTIGARADDIQGSVTLERNVVQVRVVDEKGSPAVDVPLRLFESKSNLVAAGKSDASGKWSYPLERSGKYEVEIVCSPALGDSYRTPPMSWTAPPPTLPCCQASALKKLPTGVPEEFPLETVAVGLGCLGAAGSVLFLRRLGTPA